MILSLERLPRPVRILVAAVRGAIADDTPHLGASIAYYTLFALAPMLVVVIAVAGMVYGQEAVRGEIVGQIDGLVGRSGAELIQSLLQATERGGNGILAVVIGSLTFLIGATGTFVELQRALNLIWKVEPPDAGAVKGFILHRLRSFGMVLAIGFLLLVSLSINAALAASATWVHLHLPAAPWIWSLLNQMVSLAVIALLFAAMYRLLPDLRLPWRTIRTGAIATALLFTVGKYLIGLYLGKAAPESGYGAAGSVVILLLWIFYSAQIVLLGAEIVQVGRTGLPGDPSRAGDPALRGLRADG